MFKIFLISTLVISPALALGDEAQGDNVLGLYFDEGATQYQEYVPSFVPFNMYLVLTESGHTSVSGLEVRYLVDRVNDGIFAMAEEDFFSGVNSATGNTPEQGEYLVSWPTPVPVNEATVLVKWVIVTDYNTKYLSLLPVANQTITDGLPAIFEGGTAYPATVSSGDVALSVAVVNPPYQAAEVRNWDSVKALFR